MIRVASVPFRTGMPMSMRTTSGLLSIARRTASRPSSTRAMTLDRKSTRLNSSHSQISYAVFCLKKKKHFEHLRTLHGFHALIAAETDLAPTVRHPWHDQRDADASLHAVHVPVQVLVAPGVPHTS